MHINKFVQFGFIQGDGCLGRLDSLNHKGLEVNIGKDDDDIIPLFGLEKKDIDGRKYYLTGYNDELRELGFSSKQLPERVFPTTFSQWDDIEKLSFLRGLFSANGSALKGYGRISFKSTCYDIILQIKDSLEYFEIISNITINKGKNIKFSNGDYLCKQSYDLNIGRKDCVKLFMDKIGFVQDYKNKKIDDYFNNTVDNSTTVKGVSYTPSKKYEAIVKVNGRHRRCVFDKFDDAVRFKMVQETYKKHIKTNKLFNTHTNTFQLTYLNPQDSLTTFIEVSLQGEIIQFKKL
jgi:hypothetical protein